MLLPARGAPRRLAFATLVNTTGSGLYLPASALYFTRVAGLSVGQLASGLAIAGLCGLAAVLGIGVLADRFGARRVYVALLLVQAATMAGFTLVRSFAAFLALAIVYTAADRGAVAARGALIAVVGDPGADRVRLRAHLRSLTNVGISAGAGLAAIGLAIGTDEAYTAIIALNALTFVATVALLAGGGWPAAAVAAPLERPSALLALRDAPYVGLVLALSVLALHIDILTFAVPLWIAGHTAAPTWTAAAVVVVNTVLVVALQVRASRGTEQPRVAARAGRRAGVLLLASVVALAFAAQVALVPALALLAAFAVAFTLGEILFSASAFGLSFGRAPEDAHGQYQALLALGQAGARAASPALLTVLCLTHGLTGWALLGVAFAIAGAALEPAARWAERRPQVHRPHTAEGVGADPG
ncbi:MAG: hypothetical protein QOG56_2391 [Solirubrobacteraceae bacterium]|nr:hypothetical protein [Solirubrobacteraceae bacterium]